MVNGISIKQQLLGVLAVVVCGFIAIGLAYQAALGVDDAAFTEAQHFNTIGTLADRVHSGMLEAQSIGSEFLLTNQLPAVERHRQTLDQVDQDIIRLSQRVIDPPGQVLIQRIRQSVQSYQTGFERMAELRQTYGLDADHGQLGELHQAARAMEEVIKQYGGSAQNLLTSMLMMRRNEKDYIAYRDADSLSRMPAERTRFEMFLEGAMLLQEDQAAITSRLNDYHAAFARLVDIAQHVDAEQVTLRQAIRNLEPVLAELQQHKNQLLQQGQLQVQTERTHIGQVFIGVIVGVGLLASLLLLWVTRSVLRPLGGEPVAIAALVQQVAEGDLSMELTQTDQDCGIYAAVQQLTSSPPGRTGIPDFTIRVFCFIEDGPEELRLGFRRFDSPKWGVLRGLNRSRKLPQVSHPLHRLHVPPAQR